MKLLAATAVAPALAVTTWLGPRCGPSPVLMAAASAEIAAVLRLAPIEGHTGLAGHTNVQGEAQKQLDVISNDIFIKHLRKNF